MSMQRGLATGRERPERTSAGTREFVRDRLLLRLTAIRAGCGRPRAARILLLQALGKLVGVAILFELAIELDDLVECARMLFLVLAVEQVGVQIGEQGVLGPIGRAEAVAEGVVGGGLGGRVFRWVRLDHLV